jgi:hypothetical protein
MVLGLVVAAGAVADPPRAAPSSTVALLDSLVNGSLKVADEDDPLRRAHHCTDVAGQFAKELARASKGNNRARAERLAGYLDRVWQQGVTANLARIPLDNLTEKRLGEVHLLRDRADRINQDLEAQMRDGVAPPPGIKMPRGFENAPVKGKDRKQK